MLIFTQFIHAQQHHVQIFYAEFYRKWTLNVESTDGNFFMPLNKVWFSPGQFSQSLQSVNKFYWPSPLSDFLQVG
jgi:hypothetical protein